MNFIQLNSCSFYKKSGEDLSTSSHHHAESKPLTYFESHSNQSSLIRVDLERTCKLFKATSLPEFTCKLHLLN